MLLLSKILSAIFRISLVLVILYAVFAITAQIRKKEIKIRVSNGFYYLGRPGIDLSFIRQNSLENIAPDTIINYRGINQHGDSIKATLSTHIPSVYGKDPNLVPIDTAITVIRDNYESFFESDSITEYNLQGPDIKRAVNRKQVFGSISEETQPKQLLRVQPRTTGQYLFFIVYSISWFGSIIVLVYLGMRLFSTMGKRDYFNNANARLFRFAGLFLLIPQALKLLTYNLYCSGINPAKAIIANGKYTVTAQYTLIADLNFIMIIIGFLLVILTYVFKSAAVIKEDNSLLV